MFWPGWLMEDATVCMPVPGSHWYSDHSALILLRCWGDRPERLKTQLQLAEVDILTININRPDQIITFKYCLLSADITSHYMWRFMSATNISLHHETNQCNDKADYSKANIIPTRLQLNWQSWRYLRPELKLFSVMDMVILATTGTDLNFSLSWSFFDTRPCQL